MAVIVKGKITITKGFNHWKKMVFSQKEKMAGMGMQFLFSRHNEGRSNETYRSHEV